MNCEQARGLAALAVSGDITPVEQGAFELHLADCPGCQAEADGFAELATQMAALREDSAPDHVYSSVRARVAAQINDGRWHVWLTAWPAFAAVAACTLILVVALRPVAPVAPQVRQPGVARIPEEAEVAPVQPTRLSVSPRTRRPVVRPKPPESADPLIVHMFTDDPDVVIYWVADAGQKRSQKEFN